MKPETPQEYFIQTEHAVRHLYAGITSCWAYYKEALKHWDISKGHPKTPEDKAALNRFLELSRKHFDLKFSEGVFAGSILQIAAMGIRYFSRNESIPESCKRIVFAKDKTAIQFCIGKELYGLPIGLIIYAARNQYNHWDDEDPYKITTNVFNMLASCFREDVFNDLAFSLGNPGITVYANEVLFTALGWGTYEKYLSEMGALLSNA
ncbi:hypothetical protein ACFLU4_07830 [Chloroflexota bacterium]